jgi:hypothetical protein
MMGTPWYLGNSRDFISHWWGAPIIFLGLWSVFWTGFALWHAAKRGEKGWFVLFLLVHTAGILEIIYLVFVVRAFATQARKKRPRR